MLSSPMILCRTSERLLVSSVKPVYMEKRANERKSHLDKLREKMRLTLEGKPGGFKSMPERTRVAKNNKKDDLDAVRRGSGWNNAT
jgi:hypothetical protein